MKIEAEKYYKTRDGRKVGPLKECIDGGTWKFEALIDGDAYVDGTFCAWREDGSFDPFSPTSPHHLDIISEWTDEGPIRTVTRREIVPGEYGIVRVLAKPTNDEFPKHVHVRVDQGLSTADELRSAAMIFSQLAEVLDENKGDGE